MANWVATFIAAISLAVSGASFYLFYLDSPQIDFTAGPQFMLGIDKGKEDAVLVPMSFINQSAQLGIVYRVALIIKKKGSDNQNYISLWSDFYARDLFGGPWTQESIASALPILGNSTEHRLVHFILGNNLPFQFTDSVYDFSFLVWTSSEGKPSLSKRFTLSISQEAFEKIQSAKNAEKKENDGRRPVYLSFDDSLQGNSVFTKQQLTTIFE